MVIFRIRPILLLFLLVVWSCAENRLTTYMLVQQGQGATQKKGQVQLSVAPLVLTVVAPNPEELEELAEDLKLATVSKYHRLPPLTYLRFEFENRSALGWQLNLGAVRFSSGKRSFGVVKASDYTARFTSVAYEHFRYDAMYASYITKRGTGRPAENFWFTKKAPNETIEIGANEAGFQVLPFEFIPPGVEDLTMHYTLEGQGEKNLSVKLVTERGN
ncbi:MAG: hypothetical protein ACOY5B_07440 [Spirochaetota bacterium]